MREIRAAFDDALACIEKHNHGQCTATETLAAVEEAQAVLENAADLLKPQVEREREERRKYWARLQDAQGA